MTARYRFLLPDGLYRYVYRGVVVGFVVRDGWLAECAPWLRARVHRADWRFRMTTARRVGP